MTDRLRLENQSRTRMMNDATRRRLDDGRDRPQKRFDDPEARRHPAEHDAERHRDEKAADDAHGRIADRRQERRVADHVEERADDAERRNQNDLRPDGHARDVPDQKPKSHRAKGGRGFLLLAFTRLFRIVEGVIGQCTSNRFRGRVVEDLEVARDLLLHLAALVKRMLQ